MSTELLVVTFTERRRREHENPPSAKRSAGAWAQAPPPRLAGAGLRSWNTRRSARLHSFLRPASSGGSSYPTLIPISASDEDEVVLLKSEVAGDLFLERYDTDETARFQHLIDAFGDGNDQRLIHTSSTRTKFYPAWLTLMIDRAVPQSWAECRGWRTGQIRPRAANCSWKSNAELIPSLARCRRAHRNNWEAEKSQFRVVREGNLALDKSSDSRPRGLRNESFDVFRGEFPEHNQGFQQGGK